MLSRPGLLAAMAAVSTLAIAQEEPSIYRHSWHFMAGPVFGQPILGSEDTRRGQVYYFGRSFYSRRLSSDRVPAQLVTEVLFNNTLGGGYQSDIPSNLLQVFGYAVGIRFFPNWVPDRAIYAQVGLGVSYADQTTVDLDSHFNTTPYLALGTTWAADSKGEHRWMFEIRFFHLSNGGTVGHNQGSNQLQYLVGYQF